MGQALGESQPQVHPRGLLLLHTATPPHHAPSRGFQKAPGPLYVLHLKNHQISMFWESAGEGVLGPGGCLGADGALVGTGGVATVRPAGDLRWGLPVPP